MRLTAILGLSCLGATTFLPRIAIASSQWNLKLASTALWENIYDLHMLTMIVIAVIFVGVFGFMFYAILKHRKSVGHQAAHFHENTTVEIIWSVIPVLILIGMAWPATRALLESRNASAPDITIKVTGYQGKWGYEYLGNGIKFDSSPATLREQIGGAAVKSDNDPLEVDNPLVVPVGKKVRILTTSNDVLHSWHVPDLSVKQDALPGVIRDARFRAEKIGTYRGQCALSSDKGHGPKPIVVDVVSEADYRNWVAEQKSVTGVSANDPD